MPSRILIVMIAAILASATPSMAQTRQGRNGQPPRRTPPAPAQPEVSEPSTTETPAETTTDTRTQGSETRAGTVILPNQGYVPQPELPPPGTAANFAIPSDPLDRAYWELYDRDKSVTLTGKVTRVEWSQPNSYIYLQANGANWVVESGYVQFRQASVTPPIRVDEVITITGYLPRADPATELPAKRMLGMATFLRTNHLVRAGEITTVFGQKLLMGRPPSEREMSERYKCSPFSC
jgi:hypothetical protein